MTRLVADFLERHPQQAARVLEELSTGAAAEALESVSPAAAARVLAEMIPAGVHECFERMGRERSGAILDALPVEGAVALLVRLPAGFRAPLLDGMSPDRAVLVRRRLEFPPDTVGHLMETAANVLPMDIPADRARVSLPDPELPYVYIVDGTHKLAGVLTLRELGAGADQPIRELIGPVPVVIPAFTSLETARSHPGWTRFDALPVVDREGVLLGILRHRQLRRAMVTERSRVETDVTGFDAMVRLGEAYCSSLWEVVAAVTSTAPGQARDEDREGADA